MSDIFQGTVADRPWTAVDDFTMTNMIAEGASHRDVAAKLGRTKEAIKTRVKKLRRQARARSEGSPPYVRQQLRSGVLVSGVQSAPRVFSDGQISRSPLGPEGGIFLTDLCANQCRQPMWGHRDRATNFYCGAPISRGAYCEFHAADNYWTRAEYLRQRDAA